MAVIPFRPLPPPPSTTAKSAFPAHRIISAQLPRWRPTPLRRAAIRLHPRSSIQSNNGASSKEEVANEAADGKEENREDEEEERAATTAATVAEIKELMKKREEASADDLWGGVAAEVREIEWPAFGKVLGTTGIVLAVIAGSSVALLTVNAVLAEISDRVFVGRGLQDFFG